MPEKIELELFFKCCEELLANKSALFVNAGEFSFKELEIDVAEIYSEISGKSPTEFFNTNISHASN
jgi:hypothetical protein